MPIHTERDIRRRASTTDVDARLRTSTRATDVGALCVNGPLWKANFGVNVNAFSGYPWVLMGIHWKWLLNTNASIFQLVILELLKGTGKGLLNSRLLFTTSFSNINQHALQISFQFVNVYASHRISLLPTALARKVKQSVASVRPSVRLFPLYLLNRLIFELEFVCVCGGGSRPQFAWNWKSRS